MPDDNLKIKLNSKEIWEIVHSWVASVVPRSNPLYAVHCSMSTGQPHDGSKTKREKVVVVVTEQTKVSPWRAHGE